MELILVGYPGSQCIVAASKYLTNKYLPFEFNISYVNYKGDINKWAAFVSGYLSALKDKNIVFALDDYLIASFIDMQKYKSALNEIGGDVVCVKLCNSTQEEHIEYPVTTQYCIWNRQYLIELLEQVNTPWEFEMRGSKIFDKEVLLIPCLEYFTNSSISSRWEGIKLEGLKDEDINYIKQNLL